MKKETFKPDEFRLSDKLRSWMGEKFPQLDPDETFERFCDWADDKGTMSKDWEAKFRRVVRTGVEKQWGGIVVYRSGKNGDPKWAEAIAEGKAAGFRAPLEHETPQSYRTQIKLAGFDRQSNVVPMVKRA